MSSRSVAPSGVSRKTGWVNSRRRSEDDGGWFYLLVAGAGLVGALAIAGFVMSIIALVREDDNTSPYEISVNTFTTNYTEGTDSPFDLSSPTSNCNYVDYETWVDMECNFVFPAMNSTNNGTFVDFSFQLPVEADITQAATGETNIYPDGGITGEETALILVTGNCRVDSALVGVCDGTNVHTAYTGPTVEGVDYIGTLSIRYEKGE